MCAPACACVCAVSHQGSEEWKSVCLLCVADWDCACECAVCACAPPSGCVILADRPWGTPNWTGPLSMRTSWQSAQGPLQNMLLHTSIVVQDAEDLHRRRVYCLSCSFRSIPGRWGRIRLWTHVRVMAGSRTTSARAYCKRTSHTKQPR